MREFLLRLTDAEDPSLASLLRKRAPEGALEKPFRLPRHTPINLGAVANHHGVFHNLYTTRQKGKEMPSHIQ